MFKFWKRDKISTLLTDTFIGEGTIVEGPIRSAGSVRLEGQLRGDIFSEGDVFLGDTAFAISNITARNLFIAGQVTGNVRISGKLTITASGKLYGNMDAAMFSVEEGGVFQGTSSMDTGEPVISPLERRGIRERRVAADPNWTGEERRSGVDRRESTAQSGIPIKKINYRGAPESIAEAAGGSASAGAHADERDGKSPGVAPGLLQGEAPGQSSAEAAGQSPVETFQGSMSAIAMVAGDTGCSGGTSAPATNGFSVRDAVVASPSGVIGEAGSTVVERIKETREDGLSEGEREALGMPPLMAKGAPRSESLELTAAIQEAATASEALEVAESASVSGEVGESVFGGDVLSNATAPMTDKATIAEVGSFFEVSGDEDVSIEAESSLAVMEKATAAEAGSVSAVSEAAATATGVESIFAIAESSTVAEVAEVEPAISATAAPEDERRNAELAAALSAIEPQWTPFKVASEQLATESFDSAGSVVATIGDAGFDSGADPGAELTPGTELGANSWTNPDSDVTTSLESTRVKNDASIVELPVSAEIVSGFPVAELSATSSVKGGWTTYRPLSETTGTGGSRPSGSVSGRRTESRSAEEAAALLRNW